MIRKFCVVVRTPSDAAYKRLLQRFFQTRSIPILWKLLRIFFGWNEWRKKQHHHQQQQQLVPFFQRIVVNSTKVRNCFWKLINWFCICTLEQHLIDEKSVTLKISLQDIIDCTWSAQNKQTFKINYFLTENENNNYWNCNSNETFKVQQLIAENKEWTFRLKRRHFFTQFCSIVDL